MVETASQPKFTAENIDTFGLLILLLIFWALLVVYAIYRTSLWRLGRRILITGITIDLIVYCSLHSVRSLPGTSNTPSTRKLSLERGENNQKGRKGKSFMLSGEATLGSSLKIPSSFKRAPEDSRFGPCT